ncbi:hypothetical protein QAD02_017243 [Eretmocerus hayati]|uniref:Uncharacterized protein n=1 Tax=Eretmocerus hayati TaxID=131215 RepID=A0ACC2PDB0_9HYME|nr:hypothetical protein QAD02_017243 [Eretmocerus hayati]
MGNNKSAPKGLDIDEKAVEITDFWTHHSAQVSDNHTTNLSVFISEPSLHSGASFGKPSPLEKSAKNLMLYRHPCILKYVTSWSKGHNFYLATEQVKPLLQVLGSQTSLQICIGLNNILKALLFLHQNTKGSHNNVSTNSIYVTSEGNWKLGGFEYYCLHSELDANFLKKIKSYRYDRAISPKESHTLESTSDLSFIDKFAFAVLGEDVLKFISEDDVPGLSDFKTLCVQRFEDITFLTLESHVFFTHEFIKIYSFLNDLPLKAEPEKEEFFMNLVTQLKVFPEKVVAEQLGKLLLSRIVLLDPTAQTSLLPFVFKPKDNADDPGLLSVTTFQVYLVPKLLQMLSVRDISIRLLLLSHFGSFLKAFQIDDLKHHVLPELLVGIKDTNDDLVSATLHVLADLVPLLGSATVIGGNRARLFTDGRPNQPANREKHQQSLLTAASEIESQRGGALNASSRSLVAANLPERPSPDGGEDRHEVDVSLDEEEWLDWEGPSSISSEIRASEDRNENHKILDTVQSSQQKSIPQTCRQNKPTIPDILDLDIKVMKPVNENVEDIDFFVGMEPTIQKTQDVSIGNTIEASYVNTYEIGSLATAMSNAELRESDVGDDLGDWDIEMNEE